MVDEKYTGGADGSGGGDDDSDLTPPGGVRLIPRVDTELANLALRAQHLAGIAEQLGNRLQALVRVLGQAGPADRQDALIDARDILRAASVNLRDASAAYDGASEAVDDMRREESKG